MFGSNLVERYSVLVYTYLARFLSLSNFLNNVIKAHISDQYFTAVRSIKREKIKRK